MRATILLVPSLLLAAPAAADGASLWRELQPLYEDLHAHPELSLQEAETAAKLAERLTALGFIVTTGVGKNGVVGILKNGDGPTLMLRADMDALPVEEKTGLPYASKVKAKNAAGDTVSVMHACGHDVHMTTWIGAATALSRDTKSWRGTLMMVGQPAEEVGAGALAMLTDGLFSRFPKPDFALAFHDMPSLPAGTVGVKAGPIMPSVDSMDLIVYGKGGHGGNPHTTVDPIVLAAKIVLSLQTLVSRESNPFDPVVLTIGAIHGGTKHNIIPDEVRLQLNVRAFKPEIRKRLHDGIERIARAEATAANAPKSPELTMINATPATSNDAALAARIGAALKKDLGETRVREALPVTPGEDFSRYGEAGVPTLMMWLGTVNPDEFERAQRDGTTLPGLHSALFAPDAKPTITTGVDALVIAAKELLRKTK